MKKGLRDRELKIVQAIAEVLIPLSKDNQTKEKELFLNSISEHVACMKPETAFLYRLSLWTLELCAFFYYGSMKPMTEMNIILRDRYLNAWHNTWWSVKRTMKRFLESVIFINYYGLPSVAENVCGYKPSFGRSFPAIDFPKENLIADIPDWEAEVKCDICVIGSGAGGAVVAKELAEKGRSVIILEEGRYFEAQDFGEDVATMTKRLYLGGGVTNSFGWPPIVIPIGSCVGGTTLINSGTCFRTPDNIFRKWVRNFGLTTWTPELMKAHYDSVEEIIKTELASESVQGSSAKFLARGLNKLGHEIHPLVRNAPKCCGSGVCCFGCPTNAKQSVQLNYIPLALRAGARLYTKCKAEKIIYKRRHATEVIARFRDTARGVKGPRMRIKAKVIVSACGSLYTPVLLKTSKVPNPSGQIGRNLTLHPAAKVMALFNEEVKGWKGIPQGYYSEALVEEGVKLEGIFLQPAFTAATLMLTGGAHREVMQQYNNLALFGMMISDTSKGVVLRGVGGGALSIYNINRIDLPKYRRGLQFLADAFFKAGAERVFLPLHTLPELKKEEGITPLIGLRLRNKDLDLQAFHPLGSCRMGADPREAVLDPYARVYGLDNLFVADGSIFPSSLGVNPMLTIMAAARKIAHHIDREYF